MSTPNPDADQPMRDALQRDAAQLPKPDFDPRLHSTAMRRIREQAEPSIPQWNLVPLLTSAMVVALLASIAFWQIHSSPENKIAVQSQPDHPLHPPVAPAVPRASLLAYRTAANEGDAALFALLDRDAASLLPASAPVFRAPLP
ncbi:hypothetical protein CfE428DRAFT_1489 [Chthoniobacter flavus Ellin428]|uniref:Uncharacterized protein n=1 Tax=Chthoniobacter flavus Ellin428 TaxID=497964 RepID=B4CY48_9BACT|nr:hypothetical protein [Chthoniobacter flavus]EDY21196.1 hypothetical protein CfE428DRAFT_1489 [Chthoniobacter flavus Ellin428]TCO87565.1 hypothetical protein EV701_12167 [Chthoniobacter flavus]